MKVKLTCFKIGDLDDGLVLFEIFKTMSISDLKWNHSKWFKWEYFTFLEHIKQVYILILSKSSHIKKAYSHNSWDWYQTFWYFWH